MRFLRYKSAYGFLITHYSWLVFLGFPTQMEDGDLHTARDRARSSLEDEASRTRAGFGACQDPAGMPAPSGGGLDRLKSQFAFLAEYSDEFIKSTGVDVLIKAETAARKLNRLESEHKAEDRLFMNREKLASIKVVEGVNNRLDVLHPARVLPGATCSGAKLWLHARATMGNKGHAPVSTYDMACIGLGGCVSPRGWIELHSPSSPTLSIKMFSMGSSVAKPGQGKDDEFPELEDLSEFKAAVRVLRGAMSLVHPWNLSVEALENFFLLDNYCSKDLAGHERHSLVLTRFTDYVLSENASRWRGMEAFLESRELRSVWEDFMCQKSTSFKAKGGNKQQSFRQFSTSNQDGQAGGMGGGQGANLPSNRYGLPAYLFNDDICVLWNLGRCIKAPGTCTSKKGKPLRHVCNWRPDLSKLHIPCGKNHVATFFHR